MSKFFPTRHEDAVNSGWWALGLALAGIILWSVCYIQGILFIYGFICPLILIAAVWCAYKMLRDERSVWGWLAMVFSILCLAVSLLPWFLPIATLKR